MTKLALEYVLIACLIVAGLLLAVGYARGWL